MKKNIYSVLLITIILISGQSALALNNKDHKASIDTITKIFLKGPKPYTLPGNLFTIHSAEKILGEKAHLNDSSTKEQNNIVTYSSSYFADVLDSKSGKTGSIYFLLEKFDLVSDAKQKYSSIKIANENHEGVKVLHNIGDEAYFHSDGENFYFIMVRKGKNVFNMKVNKITSKTSLVGFNQIAKSITKAL